VAVLGSLGKRKQHRQTNKQKTQTKNNTEKQKKTKTNTKINTEKQNKNKNIKKTT